MPETMNVLLYLHQALCLRTTTKVSTFLRKYEKVVKTVTNTVTNNRFVDILVDIQL